MLLNDTLRHAHQFVGLVIVVAVTLSYHLPVALIPFGLLAPLLVLWLPALLFFLVLIFRFNLEHSDLLVTSSLVGLGVDYKMVAFPQVLHKAWVVLIMSNISHNFRVGFLLLEDIEQ